jgi:SNF2 family DNA or RNA helicase
MRLGMDVDDDYTKLFNKYKVLEEKKTITSQSDHNWKKINKINNSLVNGKTNRHTEMVREINKIDSDKDISYKFNKLRLQKRIPKDDIDKQESLYLLLENFKEEKNIPPSSLLSSSSMIDTSNIYTSPQKKAVLYQFSLLYPDKQQQKKNFLYKPLIKLWLHQKKGVNFMINRENDIDGINCFGGMQCDEPGMGKTLQMLELIRKVALSRINIMNIRNTGPTIIISTSLIIEYWIEFIGKNYPKGSFEILYLSENNDIDNYQYYDIIFATYHLVSSAFKYYDGINDDYDDYTCQKYKWIFDAKFFRIMCDESDFIVNKNTLFFKSIQSIDAKHRWYITGTPLRNTINDTRSALKYIGITEKISDDKILNILKIVMIRRLKTDVFQSNQFVYFNECYVEIRFIKFNDKIEEHIYNIYKKKLDCNHDNHIFSSITKTRQSCINSFIIEDIELPEKIFKIKYFANDCAPGLRYNKNKLNQFIKKNSKFKGSNEYNTCLTILDKGVVNTKKEYRIITDNCIKFGYRLLPKFSTKGIEIIKYINNEVLREDKVIIYYESVKALNQLSYELNEYGIKFLLISGEIKDLTERTTILNKFKSTPASNIKVLLMTKICNQGISLVCASHIIILGPGWTPWPEIQAIHRLHRPGQTKNVKVVYFIIKDTIEEYILRLSFNKLELTNKLLLNDNDTESTSMEEEEDVKKPTDSIILKFDDFIKLKGNKSDDEFRSNLIKAFK